MPFDRIEHAWETADGDMEGVVVPRMRRITTSRYEGAPIDEPASRIETETVAWDADGNVARASRTQLRRRRDRTGPHAPDSHRVRRRSDRSVPAADRAGAPGRRRGKRRRRHAHVLRRAPARRGRSEPGSSPPATALALTDDLAAAVYGASLPDFAALGYERRTRRRAGGSRSARYARTVDAQGVVRGDLTGLRGAPSRLTLDPTGCYPAAVTDAVGNTVSAEFDPRSYQPVRLTAPSGAVSTCRVRRARPPDEDDRAR